MKAMVLKEQGGPLHLEDVPVPQPGNGEVLVRVRACGLGLTLVWNLRGRGFGRGTIPDKVPRIIGHEIAGDVVATDALTPRQFDDYQPHQVRKKEALAARYQGLADAGVDPIETRGLRIEELGRRLDAEQYEHERAGAQRRAERL